MNTLLVHFTHSYAMAFDLHLFRWVDSKFLDEVSSQVDTVFSGNGIAFIWFS